MNDASTITNYGTDAAHATAPANGPGRAEVPAILPRRLDVTGVDAPKREYCWEAREVGRLLAELRELLEIETTR